MKKILAVMCIFLFVACSQQNSAQQSIPAPAAQPEPVPQPTPVPQPAPVAKQAPAPAIPPAPTPALTQASSPKTVQVSISGFKFVPASLSVNVGDTVIWTNEDSASHTVESSDGSISSQELFKGDKHTQVMTKAGTINYICGIHPSMKGSVTVA